MKEPSASVKPVINQGFIAVIESELELAKELLLAIVE
jgi:hypothetical protein